MCLVWVSVRRHNCVIPRVISLLTNWNSWIKIRRKTYRHLSKKNKNQMMAWPPCSMKKTKVSNPACSTWQRNCMQRRGKSSQQSRRLWCTMRGWSRRRTQRFCSLETVSRYLTKCRGVRCCRRLNWRLWRQTKFPKWWRKTHLKRLTRKQWLKSWGKSWDLLMKRYRN